MVLPFWGYFFNEPTKSSLIGEKSPNLVTLADNMYKKNIHVACKLQLVTFKFHPETFKLHLVAFKLHLVISKQQLLTRKLQLVSDGSDRHREREKNSLIKLTVSKRKIVTKREREKHSICESSC